MCSSDLMLGAAKVYARANQATIITPFILAGAMAPTTTAAVAANDRSQQARDGAACVQAGISTLVSLGLINEAAQGKLNYYPLGSQAGGAGLININFASNPTYIPLKDVVALHRSSPQLFDWCA